MDIFELKSEGEWREAYFCLLDLRPDLSLDHFLSQRESLIARDYHLMGLILEDKIVCVAGYVLQPHIERGTEFWLHDLVTLPTERSKGYGVCMMQYLERVAMDKGCTRLILHTRLERLRAQNFYKNIARYEEYGVAYKKILV